MGTRKLSGKLDEILGGGGPYNELASHLGVGGGNTPSCLMSWKLSYWLDGLLGLSTDFTSGSAKLTLYQQYFQFIIMITKMVECLSGLHGHWLNLEFSFTIKIQRYTLFWFTT